MTFWQTTINKKRHTAQYLFFADLQVFIIARLLDWIAGPAGLIAWIATLPGINNLLINIIIICSPATVLIPSIAVVLE